ncbi:glycoside hydrolase family 78 protein [Phytoactinopolyspora mesophila]|uniref:alpha-L-rhamnosidase n=1 Tax=Phytoactinopolyspora mesophila TaxID=2650750 RepID=A0A7K3M6A0_9ACTN|nr:glycoside hydrolase family 78 protein [Phytoactinopolyspora mesophila]NDL58851.1 Bacterial alpha-L-rhamnosidase [Phytoactinopolyspora mesophila]
MTKLNAPIVSPIQFEHLSEALGVGAARPRLSWKVRAERQWRQTSYEIEIKRNSDAPVSYHVESSEQVLVPWPGEPLASRDVAEVRVRVFGSHGARSGWSDPATVEAGLLSPDDWSARPVGPGWAETPGTDRRPGLVRRDFRVGDQILRARLYATAHGVFEAEVNGRRIGDEILAPGWTTYSHRLRYRTYDVTSALREGENTIGAWLGDGWYRGRLGFNGGHHDIYGHDLSFLAQLEIVYADGTRDTIATDETWRASFGPIQLSGLYDGERYDTRDEIPGWSSPGFDDTTWAPVSVAHRAPETLVAPELPPVRCTGELTPTGTTVLPDGTIRLDFGQNIVGRLRLRVDGPAGHVVTVRHAEVLQDGELHTRTLRLAPSVDTLVLDGAGPRVWEPRFTLHGFRYAEIEGWPGGVGEDDVVARVYHTDMERTGWLETSNPLLNRLHNNVLWSMRGNFVDIPTDCPQRDERLGWTGDIQVFAPTASFLYHCAGFLTSWLVDLDNEQLDDGTVPWFVPTIPGGPMWTPPRPAAVWGDAAVLTPWVLYQRFGDRDILARQYRSAKAWVDLVVRLAGPDRLWDSGLQLGDWLDPAAPPDDPAAAQTDKYLVATAYFAWSARHLAATARVLGRSDDERYYADIADQAKEAFVGEYITDDGLMRSDAQTAYALAIVFDLLDDEQRTCAGTRLAELVRKAGNRIATGFAGTPLITDALSSTGHVDVAYDLLLEEECPSWLYMVRQGATTIWERWDSMLPDGSVNPGDMTSFNHYALGAVADWMHRDIGGIAPMAPGYRRVRFAPKPGGGLTYAKASYESPYGPIHSHWRIESGMFHLTVELPTGTTGLVEILGRPAVEIGPGTHTFRSSAPGDGDT